mgnify:CR=1 FL=1
MWPLSRILDCVANVTVVTAELLNGLEDWIIDWSLGKVSALAVTADGTGGAAVTLEALRKNPVVLPERPPYPDYHKK